MTHPHVEPGQIVDVRRLEAPIETPRATPVLKSKAMEIVRVSIPAGEAVPTYEAQGEIVLHCLEGAVQITAQGTPQQLRAGQLVYLVVQEPFSLLGVENSILLLTVIATECGPPARVIGEM